MRRHVSECACCVEGGEAVQDVKELRLHQQAKLELCCAGHMLHMPDLAVWATCEYAHEHAPPLTPGLPTLTIPHTTPPQAATAAPAREQQHQAGGLL